MWENILPALITGVITLIGVILANGKAQAVTDTKIEQLTEEVRKHNSWADRITALEVKVEELKRRVDE